MVAPAVYVLTSEPNQFELNDEVAEIHWAGIGPMLRHENLSSCKWNLNGVLRTMPAFGINGRNGRNVWGLTFRIVNRLLCIAHPQFRPIQHPSV